jgi:peroxiredoxin
VKVSGTVVDAETGKPVESFAVIQGIDWANGTPISWDRRSASVRPRPGGKFDFNIGYPRDGYAVRIEADGYLPEESKPFNSNQPNITLDFKLKKAATIAGVVKTPAGDPVAGAEIALVLPPNGPYIRNGEFQQRQDLPFYTTDAQGRYQVPPQIGRFMLVVLHDKGYAEVPGEDLAKSTDITLQPWGAVSGTIMVGTKPGAARRVAINRMDRGGRPEEPRVYHQLETQADENGRFSFNRVPPGRVQVALQVQLTENSTSYTHGQSVDVQPGKTVEVKIGGNGRPVIGKVTVPDSIKDQVDWRYANTGLRSNVKPPEPKRPDNFDQLDEAARRKWYEDWQKSPEGQAWVKTQQESKYFALKVEPDGSFRVDDVPPGPYAIYISPTERPKDGASFGTEPLAQANLEFVMPEIPGGRSDQPLDVGTVQLMLLPHLNVGDAAPDFEVKTLDGKPLKLSDFKGKYVVVDFWATWCGPCVAEIPKMKEAYEAHKDDPHFVMLSLSLDQKPDTAKKFVEKEKMNWTHAFLGEWSKTKIPEQWAIRGIPAVFLVGPDGKILAKNLRGEQVIQELTTHLAKPH